MTLNFTWWELLIIYLFIFAAFFGVGIVLGLIVASTAVAVLKRNGVILERRYRIATALLGAAIGALANYVVATSIW